MAGYLCKDCLSEDPQICLAPPGECKPQWRNDRAVAAVDAALNPNLGGWKDDGAKDPWHLLPVDATRAVVKVLAFGAKKYGDRNWEAGMAWSRCYAALMRHMGAWWEGERADAETGMSHLWHAGCCVMFLVAMEIRGIGTDDRPHVGGAR